MEKWEVGGDNNDAQFLDNRKKLSTDSKSKKNA